MEMEPGPAGTRKHQGKPVSSPRRRLVATAKHSPLHETQAVHAFQEFPSIPSTIAPSQTPIIPRHHNPPMSASSPAPSWFTSGARFGTEYLPAVDLQVHSLWSRGRHSVAALVEAAQAANLRAIAFAASAHAGSARYRAFVSEVKAVRTRAGEPEDLEVYFALKAVLADDLGRLEVDPRLLESELVLGAVERYPRPGAGGFWELSHLQAEDAVALELRALEQLARNPLIDVLAHPGGLAWQHFGPFPVEWLEPAFCAARNHGIAVEINTRFLWDWPGLLGVLRRVNPLVSFSSGACVCREVGSNLACLRSAQLMPSAMPPPCMTQTSFGAGGGSVHTAGPARS